ncbi:MAG: menaquinone biosynthesis decarboxylase [Clostridia bacterium]|nr:MAG: menaquinone biosynthesis decarboxylase [Clostridia bacterium]
MACRDLHEFMTALEEAGELKRIAEPVSPVLEIAEISHRVVKKGGPALLFTNVSGYGTPVLTNILGNRRRVEMSLGAGPEVVAGRLASLLQLPASPAGLVDKIRALPRLAELASFFPRVVRRGPCQEVVADDFSLEALPVLQCWPRDAGRFITLPLVFTRDPDTGARNVGMYRLQVYDSRTTGMHWHRHKDGAAIFSRYRERQQRMEVAVALGADPVTIYAATAPLPPGMDELLLAGFLRQEPVELVRCRTVDLEVPAHAEIVLEGYVEPGEERLEGPFGDHTGYYSPADMYPVFHVTCLTRRREPVYPATVVGRPPMEDAFLGEITERVFLPLIKMQLPEVVDMHLPAEGVFHNLAVVAIRKSYPGQARKVMHALWGLGQMMFTKVIAVVDADVDVHDLAEVRWRVLANMDPQQDLVVTAGPLDALEHASPVPGYGGHLGIDATRKLPEEGHPRPWPEEITMSAEITRRVNEKWSRLGLE